MRHNRCLNVWKIEHCNDMCFNFERWLKNNGLVVDDFHVLDVRANLLFFWSWFFRTLEESSKPFSSDCLYQYPFFVILRLCRYFFSSIIDPSAYGFYVCTVLEIALPELASITRYDAVRLRAMVILLFPRSTYSVSKGHDMSCECVYHRVHAYLFSHARFVSFVPYFGSIYIAQNMSCQPCMTGENGFARIQTLMFLSGRSERTIRQKDHVNDMLSIRLTAGSKRQNPRWY